MGAPPDFVLWIDFEDFLDFEELLLKDLLEFDDFEATILKMQTCRSDLRKS